MKKKDLGQFYTTNANKILINFNFDDYKNVIEPFVGNSDLIKNLNIQVEKYDLDPKSEDTKLNDSLLNPPNYSNKYVITNPPYLSRNKSKSKLIFDKYDTNDLYKCFLKSLMNKNCLGGVLVLPLNFFSSVRKIDIDLRKNFLSEFSIKILNIFENQVFDDTTSAICSFQFIKKEDDIINVFISDYNFKIILEEKNNYTFGGEIYNLPQSNFIITRLTSKNNKNPTNIFLKCIDDSILINASFKDCFIDTTPSLSERSFCSLSITPQISIDKQKELIEKFNLFLNENRKKYNSLFLSSYREFTRKRISFDLIYTIFSYLLKN